ncbi:MAG: phosphoglucosamine mutase [Deltaproteobacteria bacterium]|nr:phosphoglucosamine mutase [Deltaproteobacteria bacterium]
MKKLFGTDGIRGLAGRHPVTVETGRKLGQAVVDFCVKQGRDPSVVMGRDTRGSGEPLVRALLSGVLSAGGKVFQAGVLPTPGVAYLIRELGAAAGIMVSASHNPHAYNGFKVFSQGGFKLSDEEEADMEKIILSAEDSPLPAMSGKRGSAHTLDDAVERYVSFLLKTWSAKEGAKGVKIVLDCANGATYCSAPLLFNRLGAQTDALFVQPNGKNINLDCGSEHPEALVRRVMETGADAGFAFDGDGDRIVAVDEKGGILRGDKILTICANMLKEQGALKNNVVVSTVMSNMGLGKALRSLGIKQTAAPVGDRCVLEAMRSQKADLGGEASGHIIFLNHHTTGDGLLSALQLLSAMKYFEQPLSQLSKLMDLFPQILINVPVETKPDISEVQELVRAIKKAEQGLGEHGRVLVRHSGTEPVCRVMVEGEDEEKARAYAGEIADTVRKALGASGKHSS